tara:strand:+ start:4888 stop:5859 length:972 start_codon:yes stop_codon:yes gene_type:complete
MTEKIKKKRGRKPKKKVEPKEKPPPKKRGRKPKGGKIIKKETKKNTVIDMKENVILHLKCKTEDLQKNKINQQDYSPNLENPEAYNINSNFKVSKLNYHELYNQNKQQNRKINQTPQVKITQPEKKEDKTKSTDMKKIWRKLEELKVNLRNNNASDKKSACFWCTYEFDNPAIFIPKQYNNNLLEVYGCFCSPECAVAYLKNEDIDNSRKWERYTLLNNIYSKVFNYEKNIKPAPNPFYTLDKYYGNLSIYEYRKLLQNERILMVVDKPMTKVLPEIYEENNEIPFINNNLLNNTNKVETSFRLQRKQTKPSKKVSIVDSFNL